MQLSLKKYKLFNARNALRLIAFKLVRKHKNIRVYLPEYICISVIEAFTMENIEIQYYQIDFTAEKAKFDNITFNDNDVVVCVNYYGIDFDYNDLFFIDKIYKIYDSAHNSFIDLNKLQNYDFIVIGFMKSLPFVSGGAILYSSIEFKQKIEYTSICSYCYEVSNFIYDIFLYYLYNRKIKKRRKFALYFATPFSIFYNIFCSDRVFQKNIYNISILSRMTFWISNVFNKNYKKNYINISKYFGKNELRTFFVIKGNNINKLGELGVILLDNWLESNKNLNCSEDTKLFFQNSKILKISPFMDYKLIKQKIDELELEVY